MPTYEFKNKKTGEIEEYLLSFSQVDDFKKDNPHLERIWTDTEKMQKKLQHFYRGTKGSNYYILIKKILIILECGKNIIQVHQD